MRKVIVILFMCLLFCSCGKKEENKYTNFEHYKLEDFNKYISYDFASDEYNKKDNYVVADITSSKTEQNSCIKEGIFFQIGNDNYILLKEISRLVECDYIDAYSSSNTYFLQDTNNNQNKIYLLRNGSLFEYIANKEQVSYKKISFDTSIIEEIVENEADYISSYYKFRSIKKLTSEFIYFDTRLESLHRDISVKCSLDSLACEQVE